MNIYWKSGLPKKIIYEQDVYLDFVADTAMYCLKTTDEVICEVQGYESPSKIFSALMHAHNEAINYG